MSECQEHTPQITQASSPQSDKSSRTEYDEGMRVYDSPITVSKNCNTKDEIASTLRYNIGQTCMRQGLYQEAISSFHRSLSLCSVTSVGSSLLVVKIFHCLGYCNYRIGNDDQALSYYEQALSLVSQMGLDSVHLAASLNCVAVLHFNKQDDGASVAMQMFCESLAIHHSLSNPNMAAIATVLNNIGRVHYLQSEFKQALNLYGESLSLRRQILGNESLDVAATVYNIGQTCHQLGRLEESLTHYKEFLRIAKSSLSPLSKDMALVYKGIAEIYHEQSDLKMALYYYTQAMDVQVADNMYSTDVATILNKLGNICYEMKDFATAMKHYQQGLDVEQRVLPANHPHTIITQTNIAHIHKQLGEHQLALSSYLAVHKMQVEAFGTESLNVAETLSSIGLMQYHLRDYESSFESYQEALRIRRNCYETDNHPDVASTLNSVGLVLFKQDMFELAKKCFGESLRIRREILGHDHRDVAILWYNIATIHFETGEDDLAIEMYKETLRVERKSLGEDHPDVVLTLQHLGQVHQQLGQIEEAIRYFKEALEIERKRSECRFTSLGRILNLLGNVYLQLGRIEDMMDCYVEASRIYERNQRAGETLVIAGYNFYGLSKTNPPCAPVA
mmetsp:Transcript_2541/g.4291  ORF Transcript_2541/g.4291 Transcript_2541/m.4291 type:complete len:619 (+) Transcript_2541:1-1857(+)